MSPDSATNFATEFTAAVHRLANGTATDADRALVDSNSVTPRTAGHRAEPMRDFIARCRTAEKPARASPQAAPQPRAAPLPVPRGQLSLDLPQLATEAAAGPHAAPASRADRREAGGPGRGAALGGATKIEHTPTKPQVNGGGGPGRDLSALQDHMERVRLHRENAPQRNAELTTLQPPPETSRRERARRYRLLRTLQPVTTLPRVGRCNRYRVNKDFPVQLRLGDHDGVRHAGIGNVQRCGSIWACAVCSAKITTVRTDHLKKIAEWNADRNGTTALASFTISHNRGHTLRDMRKALTSAWRAITQSSYWKRKRPLLGLDHYVRAIECTYTKRNGWHLHIHALLLFDRAIAPSVVAELANALYAEWTRGLAKHGMKASRRRGVDVRIGRKGQGDLVARYLAKLAFEAGGGRFKSKKNSSFAGRSPWEVLADAVETGLADDWNVWFEWEQGSKGMRQLYPSQGLEQLVLGDEAELDDEAIAARDNGGVTVAELPARTWAQVYPLVEKLLTVTEVHGAEGAWRWLEHRGFVFEIPTELLGEPV